MKFSEFYSKGLILSAAVLWGTTGTAQAFLPSGSSPLAVGTIRMLIGGGALLILAACNGTLYTSKHLKKKEILIAAFCVALYQPLFFTGVSLTGVALGTVLAIGSAPIFSGFIEASRGQHISRRWIFATAISILGCVVLFLGAQAVTFNALGACLALGAGFSYALYVTASQKAFERGSRVAVNGIIFSCSALMLSPLLLFTNLNWITSVRDFLPLLHLGLFTTAIPYSLFTKGLEKTSVSQAVTLTLAEPLTASILGIVLLRESVSTVSRVGILLIMVGLILSTRQSNGSNNKSRKKIA